MGLSKFAIASSTSKASVRAQTLHKAIEDDARAQFLLKSGLVTKTDSDGKMHVICPWRDQHTTDDGGTSSTYFPAHTHGHANGAYVCLHAHCTDKHIGLFDQAVGYEPLDEFEDLTSIDREPTETPAKFPKTTALELRSRQLGEYHIKGVLPRCGLTVVYGEPASGKSFIVWDMALAVARGASWRDRRVTQGRVAYVVAEGREGIAARVRACEAHFGVDMDKIPFMILERRTPAILNKQDMRDLALSIVDQGGADLIIIDTLAQVMAGGEENGADMQTAASNAAALGKMCGGATVLLVHHSGKDATKGARGNSSLRAAVDSEMVVLRADQDRSISSTKLKDGPDGGEYGFRLQVVEVGKDSDGDAVTSCVVAHNSNGKAVKARQLGPLANTVMTVLNLGAPLSLSDLLDAVRAQIPHDPATKKRDTRRQRAGEAIQKLMADGVILQKDGMLFSADSQNSA